MEVEDDGSDGIVQAEEEEEEANSEVDIFPTTSMSNRKKFPKSGMKQNANQKRLLFGMRQVYTVIYMGLDSMNKLIVFVRYLLCIFTNRFFSHCRRVTKTRLRKT